MELQAVDYERRCGVVLDQVHALGAEWEARNRRPRGLSAAEALAALAFESHFVWVFAHNLKAATPLHDADWQRLTLAQRRIQALYAEATR